MMLRVPVGQRELAGLGEVELRGGDAVLGRDIDRDEDDRGQNESGDGVEAAGERLHLTRSSSGR